MATSSETGTETTTVGGGVDFELDRFEWAGPDRLEVGGRWSRLADAQLDAPELVVELGDRHVRLRPVEPPAVTPGERGAWSAAFPWPEPRPMQLGPARLEFPGGMVVELPAVTHGRLRFSRRRFARVRLPQLPAEPEAAAAEDGRAAAPEPAPVDPLTAHAEAVAAREALLVAREELEGVRAEADRFRELADLHARRRQEDRERLQAELATAHRLAQEALQQERDTAAQALEQRSADADAERARVQEEQAEAIARLQAELEAERDAARQLREALAAAEQRATEAENGRHELAAAQAEREVARAGEIAAAESAMAAAEAREQRVRERLEILRRDLEAALTEE